MNSSEFVSDLRRVPGLLDSGYSVDQLKKNKGVSLLLYFFLSHCMVGKLISEINGSAICEFFRVHKEQIKTLDYILIK